eukprot:CAMPEP_0119408122 /NCGR_PEP_ID=MMETSP1335-20130426/1772_1 /TAXON_ID=259385 /ORGANISM="Chrysoculter rhomboideus, Strain RCC1486" /LENGTH=84 /DNA_ID=CAMNT_0007432317 /DNA_START=300 /DNA_END=555 /DNA_ORIENTATION=+
MPGTACLTGMKCWDQSHDGPSARHRGVPQQPGDVVDLCKVFAPPNDTGCPWNQQCARPLVSPKRLLEAVVVELHAVVDVTDHVT